MSTCLAAVGGEPLQVTGSVQHKLLIQKTSGTIQME